MIDFISWEEIIFPTKYNNISWFDDNVLQHLFLLEPRKLNEIDS